MKRGMWLFLGLAACGAPAPAEVEPADEGALVARVNGRPITETELLLARRQGRPGSEKIDRDEALEKLIDLELEAQAAEVAGLHEQPRFQHIAQRIRAEARAAYRDALAKQFRMEQLAALPELTEAQARAWFDANPEKIGTELIVRQVVTATRPEAERVAAALRSGTPWPKVQAELPGDASEPPPIGFDRLAPEWWEALSAIAPGESTGPVPLVGERFIVFQLLERRKVDHAFEDVQHKIVAILKHEWLRDQRESGRSARREAATIERVAAE